MLDWFRTIWSRWRGERSTVVPAQVPPVPVARQLERIILTDGVARTLFEDFAEHRMSDRGEEEIGWVLLGLRQEGEAIAVAALPAGANRDAGAAHIRFNSDAQALASRIIRQKDKRLQIIGVVHTHPGRMRSPSEGDLQGDRLWVRNLRGGEGVFAIGTADAQPGEATGANVQAFGNLCYSWYALAVGDARYRTLPVQVTIGPDLAHAIRPVWSAIEAHAEPINRLCRQFASVQLEVIDGDGAVALCAKIALSEPHQQVRVLLNGSEARYYWERNGELIAVDPQEPRVDRAVYLILAELAGEPCDTPVGQAFQPDGPVPTSG